MKRKLYLYAVVFFAAVSCKEDTLDFYNGSNYVHFTPGVDDVAEVSYNFATDGLTTREESADIPVEIRLWGYLPTSDFKCHFSIDSEKTTAQSSDYVNPDNSVFRNGYHVDTLWVTVNRRVQLLATDYVISVNMSSAESGYVVAPAKYSFVNIHVVDKIPSEPVWWGTTQYLGVYSPIKYRLLNLYLGKMLVNLDEYTNITFKEEALSFKKWLKEKWDDGTYMYYDSDGTTPLYETIPE